MCSQAQVLKRSAWYNATVDGRVLAQNGKWLIPLDLQQWPKALPNRGTLELDVLQLPMNKVPWMRDNQVSIQSRKDSEVVAPQPHQLEDTESAAGQAANQQTLSQNPDSAGASLAGLDALDHAGDTVVNSSASVAVEPALTLA